MHSGLIWTLNLRGRTDTALHSLFGSSRPDETRAGYGVQSCTLSERADRVKLHGAYDLTALKCDPGQNALYFLIPNRYIGCALVLLVQQLPAPPLAGCSRPRERAS